MPSSASAGRTESRNTLACRLAICWVRSPMRRSCSRGDSPSAERTDRPISSRRLRPGDAHHVELVEVRGEDRQELGALEQRQRRVGGQRQHPGVEVQPAQFPVEVAVLGQRVRRDRRVCGRGRWCLRRRVARHPLGVGRSSLGFGHATIIPHGRRPRLGVANPGSSVHARQRRSCRLSEWWQARRRAASRPTDRRRCRCRSAARAMRRSTRRLPNLRGAVRNRARTGIEPDPEREQCGRARAVPVADEAAPCAARGGDGLGQLAWLQARADRLAAQRCSMRMRRWPSAAEARALFSGS